MARTPRILNPNRTAAELEPIELSRELLREARAIETPGRCASLEALAGQLYGIEPQRIQGDAARIAFWANLYNALVLHCLCLTPLRGNLLWHLRVFDRVAYRVGRHDYPLNLIENGILRANRRPPFRFRPPLRRSDPRLAAAPSRIDPRIHFALNCGARSCPPIRDYDPDSLDARLEVATRAYLEQETAVDPEGHRVRLPRLMRLYRADFGNRRQQVEFAARFLANLKDSIDDGRKRVRVAYGRFDWTVAAPVSR